MPEYLGMDQRYSRQNRPGVEHMPHSPLYPGGPTWEEIINGEEKGTEEHMVWS
jgi:hypothetical protein